MESPDVSVIDITRYDNYSQTGVQLIELCGVKGITSRITVYKRLKQELVSKVRLKEGLKSLAVRLSSPAVQQLWTLYPGKQTANLFPNSLKTDSVTTRIKTGGRESREVVGEERGGRDTNTSNSLLLDTVVIHQPKRCFHISPPGSCTGSSKETVPQVEPPAEGQSSNAQAVQAVEAWKHSDFLCHNYVLNGLIDPLYNVYCKTTTAKELWESLERKYKDMKNALVTNRDSIVAAIIETRKTLITPEVCKAICERMLGHLKFNSKGNKKDKRKNDKKSKGKSEYLAPKAEIVKQKFQGTCYNCDQPGHRAANCKMPSERIHSGKYGE
ncbi:pol polyprotein [Tanacetum coccineum]